MIIKITTTIIIIIIIIIINEQNKRVYSITSDARNI